MLILRNNKENKQNTLSGEQIILVTPHIGVLEKTSDVQNLGTSSKVQVQNNWKRQLLPQTIEVSYMNLWTHVQPKLHHQEVSTDH